MDSKKRTSLVIMAAGIGSRFGQGIKQLTSFGPSGEIIMDSSVLFGVDQYEITDKGHEFLKKFIKAYSSVILKDDYEGFVSKIMVEGHTDSTGERKHNEERRRASASGHQQHYGAAR